MINLMLCLCKLEFTNESIMMMVLLYNHDLYFAHLFIIYIITNQCFKQQSNARKSMERLPQDFSAYYDEINYINNDSI